MLHLFSLPLLDPISVPLFFIHSTYMYVPHTYINTSIYMGPTKATVSKRLMPDFQHSVSVAVTVAVAVSVKTVSVQAVLPSLLGRVRGNSAAGPEPGRRVSREKEWAELQARTNGRYGKIELDPIRTDERQRRTYGNGERYFLRKLRSSYGILTDERNSYVLCYGYGNGYGNGYGMLEIRHKAPRLAQTI